MTVSKDKRATSDERASTTTKAAKAIVDAETQARDKKTEKLKAARLERDAEVAKDTSIATKQPSAKRPKP